jgi:thymidylate synthase (FAD)
MVLIIRFTADGRYVVSANIRAWRDFFKACLNYNVAIPDFVWEFIHTNDILFPEFKDIGTDVNANPNDLFNPLTIYELQNGTEQLTHIDMTVRLTNDRGVSHEEVRHRVASFAQESTRYCNYNKDKFGNEVTYIDLRGGMQLDPKVKNLDADIFEAIYQEWVVACIDAERHYNRMIELGATPQIARSVLNSSTKTELCITANLEEWKHFFKLRCAPAAHPQMREIAIPLLKAFKVMIPVVFDDIEVN